MTAKEAAAAREAAQKQNAANYEKKMSEKLKYVHATISDQSSRGYHRVKFERGEIDGEDASFLKTQGYNVREVGSYWGCSPEFMVNW